MRCVLVVWAICDELQLELEKRKMRWDFQKRDNAVGMLGSNGAWILRNVLN